MKIIYDHDNDTDYIEIQLTERELKELLMYKGYEQNMLIRKRPTSIYVRRIAHVREEYEESNEPSG